MSELVKRLENLFLKLDHTALFVEQALMDALLVMEGGKDAEIVVLSGETIRSREIDTEWECFQLLALYKPAANDLRRICFAVKANRDLGHIAGYCVKIANRWQKIKQGNISMPLFLAFYKLAERVTDTFRQTIQLFTFALHNNGESNETIMETARSIIVAHSETNALFREFLDQANLMEEMFAHRLQVWYDLTSQGRALKRIGKLCTNIAEDAIFMCDGEIVRHGIRIAEAPDREAATAAHQPAA